MTDTNHGASVNDNDSMNGREFKNSTFRQWAIEKTRGIFASNKITGADISAIFKCYAHLQNNNVFNVLFEIVTTFNYRYV